MSLLEAIILGAIQGLTEFLPVSSSGHLELAKAILGDDSLPEESLLFTVVVHFATALSTIIIFRKEIAEIIVGLLQFEWNEQMQFASKITLSMIPAVLVGVLFNDQIEALFNGQILLVGTMLLVTGALLFLADRVSTTERSMGFLSAFLVGISQAIAIMPGISRSGATICTSVLLGVDRERAARFSFLMVVPLIFGKMAKDLIDGGVSFSDHSILPLLTGFVAAFATGLFACKWMITLVKNAKLVYFSIYCFVVGTGAILASMF